MGPPLHRDAVRARLGSRRPSTRALLLPGAPTRGVSSWAAPRSTDPAEVESTPQADEPAAAAHDSQAARPADDAPSLGAGPSRRGVEGADEAPVDIAEAPLTRPPAAPISAPRVSRTPVDEFPELSEAVSAVPDAPDAGAPRSARTSVSALYTRPEVPSDDDFDALDRTIVARRKRIPWALIAPDGATVDLTSSVVILGRRPGPDATRPDAQLVAIADETRTVSKTHARLELRGDTWYVTDLESTNGVLFATLMGTEVEAPPGEEIEAGSGSSSATRRCASRGGTRERPVRPAGRPRRGHAVGGPSARVAGQSARPGRRRRDGPPWPTTSTTPPSAPTPASPTTRR